MLTEGTLKILVKTNKNSLVTKEQIWVQIQPKSNKDHRDSVSRTFFKSDVTCLSFATNRLWHMAADSKSCQSRFSAELDYLKGTWGRPPYSIYGAILKITYKAQKKSTSKIFCTSNAKLYFCISLEPLRPYQIPQDRCISMQVLRDQVNL